VNLDAGWDIINNTYCVFESDREWNHQVTRSILINPCLDLRQPVATGCYITIFTLDSYQSLSLICLPLVLLATVILLAQVGEVDDRLGSDKVHSVDNINFLVGPNTVTDILLLFGDPLVDLVDNFLYNPSP
jgi:hypothetical protein